LTHVCHRIRAGRSTRTLGSSTTCEEWPTLPKQSRIVRSAEFKKIYQSGVRVTSRYFAAFCLPEEIPAVPTRCGFTLPKAVGPAVTRNRIRRRFREAVRAKLGRLPEGWLVIFNPRRAALDAPFEELAYEVGRIFDRCNKS